MSKQVTKKRVFVPITDEMLYEHPELINGPLMPYNRGQPCHHELASNTNAVLYSFPSRFTLQSIRAQEIA